MLCTQGANIGIIYGYARLYTVQAYRIKYLYQI